MKDGRASTNQRQTAKGGALAKGKKGSTDDTDNDSESDGEDSDDEESIFAGGVFGSGSKS